MRDVTARQRLNPFGAARRPRQSAPRDERNTSRCAAWTLTLGYTLPI